MLDDETNARYQSWLFRKELETLNTTYTVSNRAALETDVIYLQFAKTAREVNAPELGRFIQDARPSMAAYDGHSYPRRLSESVIQSSGH